VKARIPCNHRISTPNAYIWHRRDSAVVGCCIVLSSTCKKKPDISRIEQFIRFMHLLNTYNNVLQSSKRNCTPSFVSSLSRRLSIPWGFKRRVAPQSSNKLQYRPHDFSQEIGIGRFSFGTMRDNFTSRYADLEPGQSYSLGWALEKAVMQNYNEGITFMLPRSPFETMLKNFLLLVI
jgi:hypothetical protein